MSTITERSTIEIGWVIAGQLDDADYEAVRRARAEMLDELNREFSEFSWRMPVVRRPEMVSTVRAEPVVLLDRGRDERSSHHWDFAVVVTQADFITHYKPFALAIVSRGLDSGLISTSRIDPAAFDENISRDERVQVIAGRVKTLARHLLGHLCGLSHDEAADSLMRDVREVADLDQMSVMGPRQSEDFAACLRQIADTRLEEQQGAERQSSIGFFVRSMWLNRHEILDAVRQAKPWEFPRRLTRLTTAAVSAVVILMMTAEAWDFALSQTRAVTLSLAVTSLVLTTVYVARRQQLFVGRKRRQRSEQAVITNVSTAAIVFAGMTATFSSLFAAIALLGGLLFSGELVATWATSIHQNGSDVVWSHYVRFASVAASLGITIGALGASFEDQHHFRHITFVDEET